MTERGYELTSIDKDTAEQLIAWLRGGSKPEKAPTDATWALAHCDNGVVWGRLSSARWHLARCIDASIQELRIFGEKAECLIWPRDHGSFIGRIIKDTTDIEDSLAPSKESRILRGDSAEELAEPKEFSRILDRMGAEQIIPLNVTTIQLQNRKVRLTVRHYYERSPDTGSVRIVATRLVNLTTGGTDAA